jgi:hypothetical protein
MPNSDGRAAFGDRRREWNFTDFAAWSTLTVDARSRLDNLTPEAAVAHRITKGEAAMTMTNRLLIGGIVLGLAGCAVPNNQGAARNPEFNTSGSGMLPNTGDPNRTSEPGTLGKEVSPPGSPMNPTGQAIPTGQAPPPYSTRVY